MSHDVHRHTSLSDTHCIFYTSYLAHLTGRGVRISLAVGSTISWWASQRRIYRARRAAKAYRHAACGGRGGGSWGCRNTAPLFCLIRSLLGMHTRTQVISDEPYNLLCFDGGSPPLPLCCEADAEGHVLSLGSFSKILAPGPTPPAQPASRLLDCSGDPRTSCLAEQGVRVCGGWVGLRLGWIQGEPALLQRAFQGAGVIRSGGERAFSVDTPSIPAVCP